MPVAHVSHTHTQTHTRTHRNNFGRGLCIKFSYSLFSEGGGADTSVQNAIIKFFNNPLCPRLHFNLRNISVCENLIFHQLVFHQFDCPAKVFCCIRHPSRSIPKKFLCHGLMCVCVCVKQSPIAQICLLEKRQLISIRPRSPHSLLLMVCASCASLIFLLIHRHAVPPA